MQLNEPVPDFELQDFRGVAHKLGDHHGRIVILNFWSCECPHSERADGLILRWLKAWGGEVELLSIAANQNESAQSLVETVRNRNISTVLIDAEHIVADLFEAVTTPHVFVVDKEGILRYRGAVDDVTFRNRIASRFFLKDAVDSLLEGNLPTPPETPAYGCTIVREI